MDLEKNAVKVVQAQEQPSEEAVVVAFSVDGLISRVEKLRDREFRRVPTFVAHPGASLLVGERGEESAVEAERAGIYSGLMGREVEGRVGLADGFERLARYDAVAGSVVYAADYPDREMLRLAVVRALVVGLNGEHFGEIGSAKSWDEALALEASLVGDAMFVGAQIFLKADDGGIAAGELARFPEVALREVTLNRAFGGVGESANKMEYGFALREGYALAAAMYRANGWSAVEVLKHAPPRSSGYVVRPDRWFAGDDLGMWVWPAELEEGWDEELWYPSVQRGRVGPAVIAMWLGEYIDPEAARTVYAGWRSDEYRMHVEKRIPSARRKGARVFEWVSQWDTPHSAEQVADAFRVVLAHQQAEDGDDARHVVVQKGVSVAVIRTDSDSDRFRPEAKLVDRAAVLSGAVVRYGQVQGQPFSFQPTRLEAFLVSAADAQLEGFRFDDPASGVRMDLRVLEKGWEVQKTDEVSIRWFARAGEGALIQFTTELRDVLGPGFGTAAYGERLEAVFAGSLGGSDGGEGEVVARVLAGEDGEDGERGVGSVVEVRGQGMIGGKARALWVRQFLLGDVVGTLSLQASPEQFEAYLEVVQAVFEGISVESRVEAVESAEKAEDGFIRIEVEE